MGFFGNRTAGNTFSERRANVKALRNADATLHAYSEKQDKKGNHEETPRYRKLNGDANKAASKVNRWRGGSR